jgi:hypothetical protein
MLGVGSERRTLEVHLHTLIVKYQPEDTHKLHHFLLR